MWSILELIRPAGPRCFVFLLPVIKLNNVMQRRSYNTNLFIEMLVIISFRGPVGIINFLSSVCVSIKLCKNWKSLEIPVHKCPARLKEFRDKKCFSTLTEKYFLNSLARDGRNKIFSFNYTIVMLSNNFQLN